ncbi:MAG TPA: hypothetical protein VLL51_04590 [Gemmatimonadales bacterium]|nr:hypothetical protein [Gemmatimonadales bacterium]
MRTVTAPAGGRTRVIRKSMDSIPRTYRLRFERVDGQGPVSGVVEIHGSRWLFKKPPVVLPLETVMAIPKGFWDTLYSVYVVPNQDVRVSIG